jgi:uncharacterized protein (DUF885 family)
MRRSLIAAFTAVALTATAIAAPKADEGARFNAWLDQVWEESLKRDPISATAIGDDRYNDKVVDFTTAAWRADNRRFVERQLKELKGFDRAKLAGQDRLSYDILKADLEESLEGERFPGWMQPLNQFGSMPGFLAQMGSGRSIQPFRNTKDYDDWYARLEAALPIVDGMIANMRQGLAQGVTQPKPIMEKVLPQLAAHVVDDPEQSIFWGPLKSFPDTVVAADRERLTAKYRALIKDQVIPAYRKLHAFVKDEYLPKARTTTAWSALPDGKAWYAYRVKQNTTTAQTPDEIHAIGLAEVARIRAEMEAVRRQVGFQGDLHAFFKHLQTDDRYFFADAKALLDEYRRLQQDINARLPKLFDVFPKADYEVREVEAFRAQSAAGASYMSASADGSRPGVFYVNTFNLKAQPRWGTETLSLHEASPGHHFQGTIAQEVQALPKFRRFGTYYVAYGEGWALYAESIGKELGLFTDPYQWFGRLNDEQLRAMRLVVDTGLHHKGWTREQAIAYMTDNSALADTDIVSEVERYIVIPGQALGYKIGQLEIGRLRAEAERELGARFDVKEFHRVVLTDGALPMSVLGTKVREWIATKKKSKA